jgi:hypothetical protein
MDSFEFGNEITYKEWVMTDPSTLMIVVSSSQFCSSLLGSNLTQCKESSNEHNCVALADSAEIALSWFRM